MQLLYATTFTCFEYVPQWTKFAFRIQHPIFYLYSTSLFSTYSHPPDHRSPLPIPFLSLSPFLVPRHLRAHSYRHLNTADWFIRRPARQSLDRSPLICAPNDHRPRLVVCSVSAAFLELVRIHHIFHCPLSTVHYSTVHSPLLHYSTYSGNYQIFLEITKVH